MKLNDSLYLSHCASLPVKNISDTTGAPWLLLGLAVQTDPLGKEPGKEVVATADNLENIYAGWAGRWMLLTSKELHLDAAGLLGCFYTVDNNGRLWVSSSAALLSKIADIMPDEEARLPEGNMNWYPLPRSRSERIRSVLPSQVLILSSGNLRTRRLPSPEKSLKYCEALDRLQESLITAIRRISDKGRQIWIPLSAGHDSRLILAAATCAGVPVKTYTMRKKNRSPLWSRKPVTSLVSKADMVLPPLIAREAGVEHRWIDEKGYSGEMLALFDEHTFKQTVENDRVYFTRGQWSWLKNEDLVLLGQAFGIGACHYHKKFNISGNAPSREILIKHFALNPNGKHARNIADWVNCTAGHVKLFGEALDWRDRFYLEQRMAGWLSAMQQGLDLVEGEMFFLNNSHRVINTMLSIPEELRVKKMHEVELIRRMAPGLMKYPINPPDPFFYNLHKKVIQLSRIVRVPPATAARKFLSKFSNT